MAGLATFNFKLSQLYPGAGEHRINTCANPDCSNFGQALTDRATRKSIWTEKRPDITPEQLKLVEMHGTGAYKLAGSDKKHRRVSRVFAYESEPHLWSDQRTIRCLGHTRDGSICNSGFSILSPTHLDEEIDRLRNFNGVLDGPSCGACGTLLLDDPDAFALDGVHERSKDRKGEPVRRKRTPSSLEFFTKPAGERKVRVFPSRSLMPDRRRPPTISRFSGRC